MRLNHEGASSFETQWKSGKFSHSRKVLTGNVAITLNGSIVNVFDPGGADRVVTMPALQAGRFYAVANIGSGIYTLTVQSAAGVTLSTLLAGAATLYFSSETEWFGVNSLLNLGDFGYTGLGHHSGLVPDPGAGPVNPDLALRRYLSELGWAAISTLSPATEHFHVMRGGGVSINPVGSDILEFVTANSAISILASSVTSPRSIGFTFNASNVDHDALLNYVADKHVAHSDVTLTAGLGLTGGGDITQSRSFEFAPMELNVVTPGGSDYIVGATAAGVPYRVTWGVANGAIDHNALFHYVANEHVDHSTVSITASTGLTGGGNLTSSRSIALDINSLGVDVPAFEDFIPFYDSSSGDTNRTLVSTLLGVGAGPPFTWFVTPDMFGGIGDGTTTNIATDTVALQQAMADPRPLYIPAGKNYLINAAATYTGGGTKIVFGSGSSSVITMTNATQDGLVKNAQGTSMIVRDLQITTNVLKTAGAAIRFTAPPGSTFVGGLDLVEGCKIWSTSDTIPLFRGIAVESDVIPTIRGNYILTCSDAGIVLSNLVVGGGGEAAIYGNNFNTTLTPTRQSTMTPNSNGAAAVRYYTGLNSIRFFGNIVQDYDCGLDIQCQANQSINALLVNGNTFEHNQAYSIGINPVNPASSIINNVTIGNNSFTNGIGMSLAVFGASYTNTNSISFVGNTVLFYANNTVNIQSGVSFNMSHNTFQAGGGATVAILLAAAYPYQSIIADNIFYPGSSLSINYSANPGARVYNNVGYNPVGSVTPPTPGASPWTYTAGATPETFVVLCTAAGLQVDQGGIALAFNVPVQVPVSLLLNPRESCVVTYSSGTIYPRVYKH